MPDNTFWGHYWAVKVDDGNEQRTWEKIDLSFNVIRTADSNPNELEISIVNLAPDGRSFIRKNCNIEFTAGYVDLFGVIYKGMIEFVEHSKQGSDWVTRLTSKDGAIQWRDLVVNLSFKKGTPVDQVITKLFKAVTVPPELDDQFQTINAGVEGEIDILPVKLFPRTVKETRKPKATRRAIPLPEQIEARRKTLAAQRQAAGVIKLEKGKLIRGAAMKKLDLFCKSYGLLAIWDDQSISIIPADGGLSGPVIHLAADSGLIGSPEAIETGYKVVSLLRHELKPGRFISLDSLYAAGAYQIQRLEHSGSTTANDWYTTLEVKEVAV